MHGCIDAAENLVSRCQRRIAKHPAVRLTVAMIRQRSRPASIFVPHDSASRRARLGVSSRTTRRLIARASAARLPALVGSARAAGLVRDSKTMRAACARSARHREKPERDGSNAGLSITAAIVREVAHRDV
jgi:hypothetical protein